MALSELQLAEVKRHFTRFCDARVPRAVRDQVRLGFRVKGHDVILFEERPAFRRPQEWHEIAIAKFRYVGSQKVWRLSCQHRDLRWHSYQALPTARDFKRLLDEVAADPTGIFWG